MGFSVVVPSKTASNLVPCVRAIREAGETARIIVVDDGAWVNACEDERFLGDKNLSCERGVKPFVFARNINIGIRTAGDDDVILLNDDALLQTHQGFSLLASAARGCPEYGLIAASCNTVGNPNQHRTDALNALRDEPRMVCFVCVYILHSTINTVGLLDERFVGYGMDDDDYSLRVRKAGLKIGIFDGCFVDHGSLRSSYRGQAQAGGDFTGNMRLFIEKWGTDNWGHGRETSQFKHLFPKEVA